MANRNKKSSPGEWINEVVPVRHKCAAHLMRRKQQRRAFFGRFVSRAEILIGEE